MRGRWTSVEVGSLALFAILFVLAGATLFGRSIVVAAPLPAAAAPVIPPGREPMVMDLLHALGPTFAGRALGDTSIEKDEIRVRLVGGEEGEGASTGDRCAGPDWVQPPGGLRLRYGGARRAGDGAEARSGEATSRDLTMTWFLCGAEAEAHDVDQQASRALDRARASVDPTRIWMTVASAAPAPAAALPGAGLLTPVVAATGIAPQWIAVLTWITGFALAIAASRAIRRDAGASVLHAEGTAPEVARRRVRSIVAVALVVAGIVLRVRLATSRALDGDEPWAFPTAHPVFSNDHDAWVHPPMFRALQGLWGSAVGWRPGDALLALRAPSVLASSVALALVALALERVGSIVLLLPLVVVALSPTIAGDGAVARPYALAACFVAVVAIALFSPPGAPRVDEPSANPRAGRGVSLALVAFGAAAWTDLLAGLAAALAIGVVLSQNALRWRARAAVAVAAAVWALPLVPGALLALSHQVAPAPLRAGDAAPDLTPIHGLGHGSPLLAFDALASFEVLGAPMANTVAGVLAVAGLVALVVLVIAARRSSAVGVALLPLAALAIVFVVATRIGLRSRNVLFLPHLAAIAVAAAASALVARDRRR